MRLFRTASIAVILLSLFIHPPDVRPAEGNPRKVMAVALRNWPPHYLTDESTGKPAGFAIDIMNAVAELSDLKVDYVVCDTWPAALKAMDNNQAVLVPNFGITDERLRQYDFTVPYETFRISIFVRSTTEDITIASDMSGRKVGVVEQNQGVVLMQERGGSVLKVFKSVGEAIMALLSGNVDALIYPEQVITSMAIRSGIEKKIKIVGEPLQEIKRGIAVRKGEPELFLKLDNAVRQLIKSPDYQLLYKKWYGAPEPFWDITRVIVVMGIVLGLTIAGLLAWRYVSILNLNRSLLETVARLKEAEIALRESEEKFRNFTEQSFVGFYIIQDGRFKYVNPKFADIFGHTVDECLDNMPVSRLVHPQDLATVEEQVRRRLTGETNAVQYNFKGIKKTGETIHVKIYGSALIYKGRPAAIGTMLDITKELELEKRVSQAQRMESIGTLAGGIAHDFNNILFPILGMAELLLEDLAPDSLEHENAGEIYKAGKRGSDLVKQILAFSRQAEHKKMPVRIQQVLMEVLKLCRSTIPANIEISQEIQSDCGLVSADATQLHQVAMNLITNAFHAVEQTGGRISLSLKEIDLGPDDFAGTHLEPGRYAMLSVADTGCGIRADVMDKIFQPYFTTKKQGKGTGLGLAVVYGIVKDHGGDIKVYSEEGKGSTFNVYLPLMAKSSETASFERVEIHPTGTESILLVDDEESIVRLERQMLERLGYRITSRISSLEAIEAFKANPEAYDLVITDMTMPNMTGDQLAKEVIRIKPGIPVIICTGFSERLNQGKADSIGVKGFLMKPIIKSDMARIVRKVLDQADCTAVVKP